MPKGFAFLGGALGAADALQNMVANQRLAELLQQQAAQKAQQQDFENQIKRQETAAKLLTAEGQYHRDVTPPPVEYTQFETTDASGKPILRWRPKNEATADQPKYIAPPAAKPIAEPKDYLVGGKTERLRFDPETGHYMRESGEVVPFASVGAAPPQESPDVAAQRKLGLEKTQLEIDQLQSLQIDPNILEGQ